jgi:serine/threonine protein kinase
MAAVSSLTSVEAFVDALQKSRLLTAERLAAVREEAQAHVDPKQLARDLVKTGTLTKWQAVQLLHGFHTLVIGNYKLLDQLGSGPTGRTYLAEHAQMGRRHALKILSRLHTRRPGALKRFLTEAERASGLHHRHLSHIYDVSNEDDRYYVVMEYAEGQNLQQLVQRKERLSPRRSADYVAQAAEGLAHAHEQGVVHGGLKPSNLLVENDGNVKILDVGQSRLLIAGPAEAGAGESPADASAFQAPEQRGAGAAVDCRTDVYSLGSVLCFLLTGNSASSARDAATALQAREDVSAELAELCCRMMADDPGERPNGMGAVREALAALGALAPVPLPPPPPPPLPDSNDSSSGKLSLAKPAAGKDDSHRSKSKKPPVAKPLPDDAPHGDMAVIAPAEGIVVSAGKASAEEASPFAGLNLDIAPRGKSVSRKASRSTDRSVATPAKSAGESTPRRSLPAMVIVGGIASGVLALSAIAALLYLAFAGRGDQKLAQAASQRPARQAEATADRSEANNPADASLETNPETNPVEVDPNETKLAQPSAPPMSAAAAVEPGLEPAVGSDNGTAPPSVAEVAAAAGDGQTAPPQEEPSEPAPSQPPAEQPPSATTEKAPAPTESAAPPAAETATPAPAEAPPEPAASPESATEEPSQDSDPFAGFAATVSLPVLPETGEPAPEIMAPHVLGPCQIDPKALVIARLKGGETVSRTRHRFDLQAVDGTALQDWEIHLLGGDTTKTVATLGVKEGNLVFQWTAAGASEAAVVNLLRNCALDLRAGPKQLIVPLRKPVTGPPLVFDLTRPAASAKWSIDFLPDAKQIFVEAQKLEGVEHKRLQPAEAAPAGSDIVIWMGPAAETLYLGLRCSTSANARQVEVRGMVQTRIEGLTRGVERFNGRGLAGRLQQLDTQVAGLTLISRGAQEAEKDAEKRKRLKASYDQQMGALATQAEKIRNLLVFAAELSPTVHFRVYYLAEDHAVDLLVTEAPPEAAADDKRPARRGQADKKGKADKAAQADDPTADIR